MQHAFYFYQNQEHFARQNNSCLSLCEIWNCLTDNMKRFDQQQLTTTHHNSPQLEHNSATMAGFTGCKKLQNVLCKTRNHKKILDPL